MFAKVQNNTVVEWPITSIHQRFPSTCFPNPVRDEDMPEGYVIVRAGSLPEAGELQKLVESNPVYNGVQWVRNYTVVDMGESELAHVAEQRSFQIRSDRNQLLTESDWTQMADSPVADKQAWAAYRQALRDVTAQQGFPLSVNWPEPPSF